LTKPHEPRAHNGTALLGVAPRTSITSAPDRAAFAPELARLVDAWQKPLPPSRLTDQPSRSSTARRVRFNQD
jgi:hypothetical protein